MLSTLKNLNGLRKNARNRAVLGFTREKTRGKVAGTTKREGK
jgi:hypothetical protein